MDIEKNLGLKVLIELVIMIGEVNNVILECCRRIRFIYKGGNIIVYLNVLKEINGEFIVLDLVCCILCMYCG